MNVDTSKWSGEGELTQVVLEHLRGLPDIALIRVEDAPATRSEADYNFISNEIYVTFEVAERKEPTKRLGIFPGTKRVTEKVMTIAGLQQILEASEGIGAPDYSDDGMMQFLRTERIIPPYQTKGYKLVELLRIYEAS
jgi:hypothetical protein